MLICLVDCQLVGGDCMDERYKCWARKKNGELDLSSKYLTLMTQFAYEIYGISSYTIYLNGKITETNLHSLTQTDV